MTVGCHSEVVPPDNFPWKEACIRLFPPEVRYRIVVPADIVLSCTSERLGQDFRQIRKRQMSFDFEKKDQGAIVEPLFESWYANIVATAE